MYSLRTRKIMNIDRLNTYIWSEEELQEGEINMSRAKKELGEHIEYTILNLYAAAKPNTKKA